MAELAWALAELLACGIAMMMSALVAWVDPPTSCSAA